MILALAWASPSIVTLLKAGGWGGHVLLFARIALTAIPKLA
jgi:hypothetical protein